MNRALSTANACLYGLVHAAIVSTGFSPALGFLHTGKMLSFVYDIADLYKVEITVPIAFKAVATGTASLESKVRRFCRSAFYTEKLLQRIVPDMQRVVGLRPEATLLISHGSPDDVPGDLWDPAGAVAGGQNFGERDAPEGDADNEEGGVPF